MKKGLICYSLFLFSVSLAYADQAFLLKDGKMVAGAVIREFKEDITTNNGTKAILEIQTESGIVYIPKDDIQKTYYSDQETAPRVHSQSRQGMGIGLSYIGFETPAWFSADLSYRVFVSPLMRLDSGLVLRTIYNALWFDKNETSIHTYKSLRLIGLAETVTFRFFKARFSPFCQTGFGIYYCKQLSLIDIEGIVGFGVDWFILRKLELTCGFNGRMLEGYRWVIFTVLMTPVVQVTWYFN